MKRSLWSKQVMPLKSYQNRLGNHVHFCTISYIPGRWFLKSNQVLEKPLKNPFKMVAIFCMHPGDAFCELTFIPTCKNVNSKKCCHFLTESGLKKDIFMSSNLSVPLAERVFFLLGGRLFKVQHNLLKLSVVLHVKTYNNV